ncbi:MAG: hypothetical protein AB8G95_06950, partial [Anaerolineae bacterium]
GQESGRPFVTVELDQPGKLITQKIVRVPTAVTLSIFKASSSYAIRMGSLGESQLALIMLLLLIFTTTICCHNVMKKSKA